MPFVLVTLSYIGVAGRVLYHADFLDKYNELFNLGNEANFPTLYSTAMFAAGALLMLVVGLKNRQEGLRDAGRWLVLAAVFLFLSVDESASIHEKISNPVQRWTGAQGYFYYAWVLVWGPAAVLFLASYIPFLLRLPRKTAGLFALGGAIFLVSAVGTEMIQSEYAWRHAKGSMGYLTMDQAQEFFELFGLAIFLAALLGYAQSRVSEVRVKLVPDGQAEDAVALTPAQTEVPAASRSRI